MLRSGIRQNTEEGERGRFGGWLRAQVRAATVGVCLLCATRWGYRERNPSPALRKLPVQKK